MHPRAPLALSKSFLHAHHLCTGNGFPEGIVPRSAVMPGIVCLAFAVELGLKSILLSEGNSTAGHDLRSLFDRLTSSTQDELIFHSNVEPQSFRENLDLVSNAFVKWRYIFETQGTQSISEEFLLMLASGVQTIAIKKSEA